MKTDSQTDLPRIPGRKPRVLVVEARFYDHIADELLAGARAVLEAAEVDIDVITVPGALEIPGAVAMAARAASEVEGFKAYDGFVVLGCVIRGETTHYDIVANESNRTLMQIVMRDGIALGNGILTVETEAQAIVRAKASEMDKGGGAARACLTMIAVQRGFGLEAAPPADILGDVGDDDAFFKTMLDELESKASKKGRR